MTLHDPLELGTAATCIRRCGFLPKTIRNDFADQTADFAGQELRLQSSLWEKPGLGLLRLASIRSDKGTAISNLAFFPNLDVALPLVQAERVVLRDKLMVAILDATMIAEESWHSPVSSPKQALDEIKQQHPSLAEVAKRPEWANGYISPDAIWVKQPETATAEIALDAEEMLLDWLSRLLHEPTAASDNGRPAAKGEWMEGFRAVFLKEEPSRPFLTKAFGSAWAEEYMRDFLFLADRSEG